MIRGVSVGVRATAGALLAGVLSACGHIPATTTPAEAPETAFELQELAEDGTPTRAFPQFWTRNTLVVDLQSAASRGKVIFKPRKGHAWPVRIAFRARPGTLGVIEVRADQRMIIPVTTDGSAPVDLELAPGVYSAKSEQLVVQWGR
jgi:hypothetical protein